MDSRRDCNLDIGNSWAHDQNLDYVDYGSCGLFTLNLYIDKNVFTPNYSQLMDFPTLVTVTPGVLLKINKDDTLDFTEVVSGDPTAYFRMNVESNGRLYLDTNARILIRNKNWLNLKAGSKLFLDTLSEIVIEHGGIFCNEGASIRGRGGFSYKNGHHLACATDFDFKVNDSTKMILQDSAVLELPDDYTIHLSGSKTTLIMNPYSKILFGENSKIIIDSSAKIIANNATFARPPAVSPAKWAGRPACSEAGI